MTPEIKADRWQQIDRLFHSTLACAPEERAGFLSQACGEDEALRVEVESLLGAHEQDGSFLDLPAYEVAADFLADAFGRLFAGQQIGPYKIISPLAAGGMGEVYLAQDTRLGRKIALKLLPQDFAKDQHRVRRFAQEARAASALNHPNVCVIHEVGKTSDGRHFIAMELIEGITLRERISRSPLSLADALTVAEQVAAALTVAHAAGVVHRDIKPENIMLRQDGYVKVLDFGLAKLTELRERGPDDPTQAFVMTTPGVVMGTVSYMSPEQARGLTVDARTDLWSLGVVLYEMTTGRLPFTGSTNSDVMVSLLEREPPPLLSISEAPETLEWIVSKALTKEREDRYQTAREMLTDLRRLKERLVVDAALERSVAPHSGQPSVGLSPPNNESQVHSKAGRVEAAKTAEQEMSSLPETETTTMGARGFRVVAAGAALAIVVAMVFVGLKLVRREPPSERTDSTNILRTTQITFSTGLDQSPSLSPDGNSVAYTSDQSGNFEIYVKQLTPGGREIQLTSDGQHNLQPAWSPDGQRIAFYSQGGGIW